MLLVLKIIGIVILAVVVLIAVILSLNVSVIAEYDGSGGGLKLLYRILFFTFGKNPDPNSRIAKLIKKILGIDRLETEAIKSNVEKDGVSGTLKELSTLIYLLFGKIIWLLERATLRKFKIHAVCGGEDAADTAFEYGLACAVVYPLAGYVTSVIKTKEKGEDVSVICDFDAKSEVNAEITVSVRIIYAVYAAMKNLYDRAEAESGGQK